MNSGANIVSHSSQIPQSNRTVSSWVSFLLSVCVKCIVCNSLWMRTGKLALSCTYLNCISQHALPSDIFCNNLCLLHMFICGLDKCFRWLSLNVIYETGCSLNHSYGNSSPVQQGTGKSVSSRGMSSVAHSSCLLTVLLVLDI